MNKITKISNKTQMLIFLSKMRVEIQENLTLAVEDSSRKRSGRSQSVSMMNGVMSIHGRNTDMSYSSWNLL